MPNFYYTDENGERELINGEQLKALVAQGVITPDTILETDAGQKGKAGQIKGLFATTPSPAPVPLMEHTKNLSPSSSSTGTFIALTVLGALLVGTLVVCGITMIENSKQRARTQRVVEELEQRKAAEKEWKRERQKLVETSKNTVDTVERRSPNNETLETRATIATSTVLSNGVPQELREREPQSAPTVPPAFMSFSQINFMGLESLVINWDAKTPGSFDSAPLVCPSTSEFAQGNIYRLKLSNIPGHPGRELFPTLEIAPPDMTDARTQAFLAHNSVPVEFDDDDFDQVFSGNFVIKVVYLPNPEFQGIAVNTQLQPRVDPIVEASKRGTILAVIRMGNKDLTSTLREENTAAVEVVMPDPDEESINVKVIKAILESRDIYLILDETTTFYDLFRMIKDELRRLKMPDIHIDLDRRALRDTDIRPDTIVAPDGFDSPRIQLKSTLNLLLRPHNLTYIIQDESLLITTVEESKKTGASLDKSFQNSNIGGDDVDNQSGKATVNVFGTSGEGTKFMFVFDRSDSMNANGRIRIAKAELIRSLESLKDAHQFNIIFYNHGWIQWRPGRRLIFASEVEKRNAEQFVENITASGGTRHFDTLKEAIAHRPDVIFFLTDGEATDDLTPLQLREIERLNNQQETSVQLNVIQFGGGGVTDPVSKSLKQLADHNHGQYQYVNIGKTPLDLAKENTAVVEREDLTTRKRIDEMED